MDPSSQNRGVVGLALVVCLLLLPLDRVLHAQDTVHDQFRKAAAMADVADLNALSSVLFSDKRPEDRPLALLAAGVAKWRSNRKTEALELLDSAAAIPTPDGAFIRAIMLKFKSMRATDLGAYDHAIELAEEGLRTVDLKNLPLEHIDLLVIKAEAILEQGDLARAQELLERALGLATDQRYDRGRALVLLNQGNIAFYQARYDEAYVRYGRALGYCASLREVVAVNAMNNLISALIQLDRYALAIHLLDSMLVVQATDSLARRADLLGKKGYVLTVSGEAVKAIPLLRSSVELAVRAEDGLTRMKNLQHLANALWKSGDRIHAREALAEAMVLAEQLGRASTKKEMFYKRSQWAEQLGELDEALLMHRAYADLSDSLAQVQYSERLAISEARFGAQEKDHQIAEQTQALALAAAEDRRKNIQRIALGISALAVTIIALLLARSLRNRRRLAEQEQKLHAQRVDELLKQSELDALNAMMEGQEKERDRVARDLHDRLGSMLSAIKHQIDGLDADIQGLQTEQRGNYSKVNRMLDEAVGEVRRISHDMVSVTLARFGLEKALEDLCDSVRLNGKLAVELALFGLEQRMERGLEITVYRMVQELVSNVLKHAGARELSISVTRGPGRISVIVADDGRGFDTDAAADGIGLANVRARAAAMGAQVTVNSTPGKGTTVSIEGPVVE
jgi:signal transduction histidine kinase